MSSPDDRTYSDTHEWHLVKDDTVTIGLTEHAVDQLTDVTFVEMKPSGTVLDAGDTVGEVESVKTTSDVMTHVAGEIIEVNDVVEANPDIINSDPYGTGWLVKIRMTDTSGLDDLMDADTYDDTTG